MSKFKTGDDIICVSRYDDRGLLESFYSWFTIAKRYRVEAVDLGRALIRDDCGLLSRVPEHAFIATPVRDPALEYLKRELTEAAGLVAPSEFDRGWTMGLQAMLGELYGLEAHAALTTTFVPIK